MSVRLCNCWRVCQAETTLRRTCTAGQAAEVMWILQPYGCQHVWGWLGMDYMHVLHMLYVRHSTSPSSGANLLLRC
jgi:hypothetical protein